MGQGPCRHVEDQRDCPGTLTRCKSGIRCWSNLPRRSLEAQQELEATLPQLQRHFGRRCFCSRRGTCAQQPAGVFESSTERNFLGGRESPDPRGFPADIKVENPLLLQKSN